MAAPACLVAVAYLAVPALSELGGTVLHAYTLSAVLSACTVGVAVALHRPRPAGPWLLVTAAVASWMVGDVLYGWSPTAEGWAPDLAFLAAYACLIGALVRVLRARAGHREVDTLLDAAMVGVAALAAVWQLIIQPTWGAAEATGAARVVAVAYPVLDVVLLVLLVQLVLATGRRSPSLLVLAAAVAATFVADVGYALLVQTDAYSTTLAISQVVDGTWLVGYALFALAACHPSMRHVTVPATGEARFGAGRLLATGLSLLSMPLVHALADGLHGAAGIDVLLLSTLVVVPLVVWRIARLNRATQAALDEVARREAYYRGVALRSSDAFVVVDRAGVVLDVSQALDGLLRITAAEAVGTRAASVLLGDDGQLADALLAEAGAEPGTTLAREVLGRTGDGEPIWLQLRVTNLLDDPAVAGIVINAHDITDRKRAEAGLLHQALHDSLTGLANRSLVRDRIDHALRRRTGRTGEVSVLYCDLDGFKAINDGQGHDAGDEVLRVVAHRLVEVVRPADTVARMGGDEFVVVLEQTSPDDAAEIAGRILATIAEPIVVDGSAQRVTASIGLTSAEVGVRPSADDLLRDADTALYGAKGAGRNRVVHFDPAMREQAMARQTLELELVGALAGGQLELHYQPVVSLRDGRLKGFEALLRWAHPTHGLLEPDAFLALAEDTGAIVPIGAWVLRTACAEALAWQALAPPGEAVAVSVNVSARQLVDADLVANVADALAGSGLDPQLLVLELNESVLVRDPAGAAERLRALRDLGVRLAIDDFGVGYSTLGHRRHLPFDILKIDRSFVDGIDDPERLPSLVRGLLELGGTLELEVVAEGIEDEVQRRSLVGEGCELGQGSLFARPMAGDDASAFVIANALVATG